MAHLQQELARDRQRGMLDAAAAQRDGSRATMYSRIARRAERAERHQLSHRSHATRLRAELEQIEAVS
jgi:hypothetical protein